MVLEILGTKGVKASANVKTAKPMIPALDKAAAWMRAMARKAVQSMGLNLL